MKNDIQRNLIVISVNGWLFRDIQSVLDDVHNTENRIQTHTKLEVELEQSIFVPERVSKLQNPNLKNKKKHIHNMTTET